MLQPDIRVDLVLAHRVFHGHTQTPMIGNGEVRRQTAIEQRCIMAASAPAFAHEYIKTLYFLRGQGCFFTPHIFVKPRIETNQCTLIGRNGAFNVLSGNPLFDGFRECLVE